MTREDLEEMTKPELIEHGQVQGIKLDPAEKKGTMIDRILGVHIEAKPAKKAEASMPALGRLHTLDGSVVDAPNFRVMIFDTETDHSDVDIICNGHNVRIQRGKEVILMEPFVEMLRNAVIDTVVQDPDTGVRSAARRQVYPFQATPL